MSAPRLLRTTTTLLLAGALALPGCSTTGPAGGGALTGTLYVHAGRDTSGRTVYKIDLRGGGVTGIVSCQMPDALPDGRILCVSSDLVIFSADGAQKQVVVPWVPNAGGGVFNGEFSNPRMSPDGKYVAYDDDMLTNPSVYVVEVASGALVKKVGNTTDALFSHPAWAPDGSLYFQGSVVNFNHSPGLYKLDRTFATMTRVDKNLSSPAAPSVSPDGAKVAFVISRRTWTMNADGSGAAALVSPDIDQDWPAWSPDGKTILANTGNCDVAVLDAAGGAFSKLSATITGIGGAGTCPNGQMTWR